MDNLFENASRAMTVVSFITFMGIIAWAYARRNQAAFAQAAQLPFADEETDHV